MNNQKSKNASGLLMFFMMIICFGGLGLFIGFTIKQGGATKPVILLRFGYSILCAFITVYASIIIHESGHLVMGLRSGYDFVSFRIGSLVLIKQDGKLVRKKMSLKGTSGQCLLMPKEMDDPEQLPCQAYFIGGGLFIITAAIAFPLMLLGMNLYIKIPIFMLAFFSLYFRIINLIPFSGEIANDGCNVESLRKHPSDRVFVYNQLRINGLMAQGKTPLEIDPTLFETPDGLSPMYVTAAALIKTSPMLMKHEYAQVRDILNESLKCEDSSRLYINETKCELIFCESMLRSPKEEIDKLFDQKLLAYIKVSSKTMISKPRVMYAYYKLCVKDEAAAKAEYDKAMSLRDTYPIAGELKCELELIDEVTKRSEETAQ